MRPNRIFVLDTNVLLHDSNAIFTFKGVVVGIPFVVLEELDTFKGDTGEIGRHARLIIRTLDNLRSKGCLSKGVELNGKTEGSILKILPTPQLEPPFTQCEDVADNLILQTIKNLIKEGNEVTFVTKDINARVKADVLGIPAEDYIKGIVSSEDFYRGWTRIAISANDLRKLSNSKIHDFLIQEQKIEELFPNEFFVLESDNNPENNRLFRFLGGKEFKEINNIPIISNFSAKNIQQLMALDLLFDDRLKIISLIGPAGTGKTFLALLAGLQKVAREKIYRKFLITRPVVALGADIGYLPGELEEKLRYWMQPIYDNLEFIFSQMDSFQDKTQTQKHKHKYREYPRYSMEESAVDHLIDQGILSLEAITYMRGRSIPYQFVLVDEVQNLNPHEVKTIVSRAGEGTKIILAGDPYQIDSPYLDFSSNGLTVTTDKFKGQSIFGTVFLEKSERSELAKLAAKIL